MYDYLFDKKILTADASVPEPGENLILRPLSKSDYKKGFLNVLKQLTKVGDVTEDLFVKRFNSMKSCPGTYYVLVVEDASKNLVVASATLVIEQKFIHECSVRGRIEDVVVCNDYRGQELGKILVSTLSNLSEKLSCYKVTLECKDELLPFYQRLGFTRESNNSNYLQKRFE
ncbi:probable glucosamine 6-phosphate N-acetyltransferase [Planococcus citri]|uniref:probable glucosamine 6-phosphate N-acetyltransferase n=1 Tax=Planococcus citri TaxID=170843 RepID=UPI0031F73C1F